MKINIGDKYVLTADQFQFIVQERKVVKEGKNAGGEYLSLVGYFPKLSQAIAGLIHLDVQMSDVQSLQEMERHIRRVSEQCEQAIKEAV
ncbi:DUF5405 family protein [Pantoea latae]|uniref:DUF5405 domain-containing protein n=1 Tax=Pantoea latae TaxID=1964541 RepID=A0A1V9DJD6_9GAMM|nr:DUF5405 family protein [Pantoea latae]OQP33885.1 hypothetical protein B2J69_09905 [Pantoea latae]